MHVNVNSDNHIQLNNQTIQHFQDLVANALDRFARRITRVEVHLADENSKAKGGGDDMRCSLEARLAGLQPVAVSASGGNLEQAINSAATKLIKTLERTLQRQDHPKGHKSVVPELPE